MRSCVIIDIEMCRVSKKEQCRFSLSREIIQIGAVLFNQNDGVISEFSSYVKPTYGEVDQYITNLTGITPFDLYNAPSLKEVLCDFEKWLPDEKFDFASWGMSDKIQIRKEIKKKNIKNTVLDLFIKNKWHDIQKLYQQETGEAQVSSLSKAVSQMQIVPYGQLHNGLSDAYNTSMILKEICQSKTLASGKGKK